MVERNPRQFISWRGVRSATEEKQEIQTHNIWKKHVPFSYYFLVNRITGRVVRGFLKRAAKNYVYVIFLTYLKTTVSPVLRFPNQTRTNST